SFRRMSVSRLLLGRNRQIPRSIFFAVCSYSRVQSPLGQITRLAKVTDIRLSVRCESESIVLIGRLARKPELLVSHRRGVRSEKGKSIESVVESVTIQVSRLRFVNNLSSLVSEALVPSVATLYNAQPLADELHGLLISSLFGVSDAQTDIPYNFPGVALDLLLKCLGRFIKLSGYMPLVSCHDLQLFPLAGMFPQLKCFAEIFAGSLYFA